MSLYVLGSVVTVNSETPADRDGASPTVRRRERLSMAFAALTLLTPVILGAASCQGGNPDTQFEEPPTSASPPQPSPPFKSPPGGGAVEVIEQGLSETEDSTGAEMVSYGIVFKNTSKYVAYVVYLNVRITDASGVPVTSPEAVEHSLYVVMPGARGAVGNSAYVDRDGATDIHVDFDRIEWWPVENDTHEVAEITAHDVSMRRSGSRATLSFRTDSRYQRTVEHPVGCAIFRNSDGEIVGGEGPRRVQDLPPGESTAKMREVWPLPDRANDKSTEVYISEL